MRITPFTPRVAFLASALLAAATPAVRAAGENSPTEPVDWAAALAVLPRELPAKHFGETSNFTLQSSLNPSSIALPVIT